MSTTIPSIRQYMTAMPHSIGDNQSIATAAKMMREYGIRHLPVLHGGTLLGMLSDRDIKLISAFRDVDINTLRVDEAMVEEPYSVHPDTPLNEVTTEMAEKKYGSAVVIQNHKVIGIFTTVDACTALSSVLRTPR